MSRSSVCALLALSLAISAPVSRAQPAAPAIAPDKPLSLDEAIALAVKKNFNLQIQANTLLRQQDQLEIAKATFDPTIGATFNKSFNQTASRTSLLEGTATDNTSFGLNASQLLPWTNGTITINTSPNLSRSATNNPNDLFNPTYNFGLGATLRQSLLRGFGSAAAHYNYDRTKIGVGLAYISYRSQVLNLISQTENAYFDLVNARETLRIRQLSLETSQRFLDESTTRRQTGVATDLDVLQAEVQVSTNRRNVIQAEQAIRNAEENLLNLINVPNFDVRPGPVKFDPYTDGTPSFAVSYKIARDAYPSTLTETETLRQLQLDLENARRNLRPALDLTAGAGYTARASKVSYSDAIGNLPHEHGRNWVVGLSYSMPWGQRADKARYHQAQLDITSQKLRIDQVEQQLIVSVRQAVRAIETQIAVVDAAARTTELSERQYEQQKARFDAGLATAFLVLQAQDTLENNRFAELTAKLQLRRSVTQLRQLEGTSIERYRIDMPKP
jgi:outer membrane protein TolC